MDKKLEGFLDDTSISKTPKPPRQASTAVKDSSKRPGGIYNKKIVPNMNLFSQDESSHALNEVTNIRNFAFPKAKFDITLNSVATDANSSLGILQMDNMSGFTDNSFMMPEKDKFKKLQKTRVQSDENKESLIQENIDLDNDIEDENPEIETDNSLDIEYDGTNIPELNLDYDVELPFEKSAGNLKENSNQENENPGDKFLESLGNSESRVSAVLQNSIFESFETSYKSLYNQLLPDGSASTIVPSMKMNPEVTSILQKDQLESQIFIQNVNKLTSMQIMVNFCPEEISARSSSFESLSNSQVNITDSLCSDSVFQKTFSAEKCDVKDLDDEIISGSSLTKFKQSNSEDSIFKASNLNNDKFTDLKPDISNLPERDTSNKEVVDLAYNNLSSVKNSVKISDTNLFSSSYLGISESEFINPDAALELFKKEEEIVNEEHMFELPNQSTDNYSKTGFSFSPKDNSTLTWNLQSQNNQSPENREISFGTLVGARTENLGTLSEDSQRERPYFGIQVSTPTKKLPNSSMYSNSKVSSMSLPSNQSLPSASIVFDSKLNEVESMFSYENKTEELEFLRDSVLSEIFDDASTFRASRLASKIFDKCLPSSNPNVKSAFVPEKDTESTPVNNKTHNFVSCPRALSKHSGLEEPGNDTLMATSSLNSSVIASNLDKDNPTLNESNLDKDNPTLNESNLLKSEAMSGKTENENSKTDACPNCKFSLQNGARFPRPSSSCSSASSIPSQSSLHGHCHSTAISTQNILSNAANCLHNGMFYNANAMYGMMPPQIMNFPAHQPMNNNLPTYIPYQFGSGAIFCAVQGPDELQFPEKICIGDTQQLKLTVRNTQHLPCLYQISSLSASINDLPVSLELSGVSFVNMVKCNNGNATDIQISLSPKYEGKIKVDLQICAFFSPADLAFSSEPKNPLKTTIKFESLRPTIYLTSKGNEQLNLGSVIAGSTVVEYITVENICEAAVPLSLHLSNDVKDNRIQFGLNQMKHQKSIAISDYRVLSPKVMLYRLPRSNSNSQASRIEIPIILEAGKSNADVNFTLTASIENQVVKEALAFLNISTSIRIISLVLTNPLQNPVYFHNGDGSIQKKSLTVKNEGSLPVTYDLLINSDSFSVSPASVSLKPMESLVIFISFSSSSMQETKSSLEAAAQPHGKVFKVADILVSEKNTDSQNARYSLSKAPEQPTKDKNKGSGCKNIIEVNKKYLAWGGVDIESTATKSFTLRNALTKPIQVKLFIKDASQSFQLLNEKNETSLSVTLNLGPREEKHMSVLFSPARATSCSGILGLRPVLGNGKTMFSIPLSGYGGIGKLKILDVPEKEGVGYCLNLPVTSEELTHSKISLQNTGFRAIYVRVIVSDGRVDHFNQPSGEQVIVQPSEFVLLENESKILLVSYKFPRQTLSWNTCGIITLIYGDEIMRQQLRRFKSGQNTVNSVSEINFDVYYEGEEKVACDSSYQSSPKDVALFKSNLKKSLVHLNVVDRDISFSRMNFDVLSTMESSFASLMTDTTTSSRRFTTCIDGHSPPVKECSTDKSIRLSMPQQLFSNVMPSQVQESKILSQEKQKADCWIVKPQELILDATSKDNRVLLINLSKRDLKFRVEHAIDIMSVSPVSGVLAAKIQIGLRVTIIPNKHKLFKDCNGSFKIFCDGSEKNVFIKVLKYQKRQSTSLSIQDNVVTDLEKIKMTSFKEDPPVVLEEVSTSRDLISSTPIQNINDFPKQITLPNTVPFKTSEITLNFQNAVESSVKWAIYPNSRMFSEFLENSVWQTNIFKICPCSGTLSSMEIYSLTIMFSPSGVDSYSQFFELSLDFENGLSETRNFKIIGNATSPSTESCEESISSVIDSDKSLQISTKKPRNGVHLDSDVCDFPSTSSGEMAKANVTIKNYSAKDIKLKVVKPKSPFLVKQSSVIVKSKKFLKIPVSFQPMKGAQFYEDQLIFKTEESQELNVKLKGFCL